MLDFKAHAGGLSERYSIQPLRIQRHERKLKSHGFWVVLPNPFVDEVGI